MSAASHKVTVIVAGDYPHGGKQECRAEATGDGGLDHMLDVFRAAVVAAGFAVETAARLDFVEGGDGQAPQS